MYFRVRPLHCTCDSGGSSPLSLALSLPIGALSTFGFTAFGNEKDMVTNVKSDSPGNDQFFAMGYYLYDTWWRGIREQWYP